MKKEVKFFLALLFLFIFIFAISSSSSQTPEAIQNDPLIQNVQKGTEKITDITENLTREDIRKEYLKQEWTKILEKTDFGSGILWIGENILEPLNPVFLIVLGVNYSVSWVFLFSVLIWIILFSFILWATIMFFPNKIIDFLIAVIITSIIGISGAIKEVLDILAKIIPNISVVLIFLLIGILIIIYLIKITREKIKKLEEEKDKQDIHAHAEASRAYFEEMGGNRRK